MASPYSPGFFAGNARNSMRSARPILQILRDLYEPTSIIDIGCGSGAWLATAQTLGFTVLRGYDGPWADPAKYTSSSIDFVPVDLETSQIDLERRYDLAMSVEVAEHLSEARADIIIDTLCAASDVVLFGAAVPFQGGRHHVHEQPQSYWIKMFQDRGYEPFDVIRPAVWNNDDVQWWFRQNTLVYLKAGSTVLEPAKLQAMQGPLWDVVHPDSFAARTSKLRTELRQAGSQNDQLSVQLVGARKQIAELEEQTGSIVRRSLKRLRRLRAKDLPQPVRPLLTLLWRLLPTSARASIRQKH